MTIFLQRLPFVLELFFNGSFILLYGLKLAKKLPQNWDSSLVDRAIEIGSWIVPFIILLTIISNYLSSRGVADFLRRYVFSLVVFVPLMITFGDQEFCFWLASGHLLSSILALYDDREEKRANEGKLEVDETSYELRKTRSKNWRQERSTDIMTYIAALKLSPAQLVLLSFGGVILLGAFLLMLPVSTNEGISLQLVDAFLIATSATCVTGLASVPINETFSLFGQLVILALIQIGGLSIMTLYSSMAILLGRSMQMKDRIIMQDLLEVSSLEELFEMIIDIIKYTFIIEFWGAMILTIAFTFEGFEFGQAFYYGIFHSISAFCSAGFSLFDTSMESFATSPLISWTLMILVTMGGLGFIVLRELREAITKKKKFVRFSLHSKIVLVTSGILTFGGALLIFFGEFLGAHDGLNLWEQFQVSMFQSVTLRSAGFNTIPLNNLNTYTIYGMTLFMFVGGSPGSTAGGIKTTTLAILIQSIISTLKGKKTVDMFDRRIPPQMVVRATALTFISLIITSIFLLIMMGVEPEHSFLTLFFEVVSASATVGLSLGVTEFLSVGGKVVLSFLMLIGRIGPLTLILAIGQSEKKGKFDYPTGRIMIG